MEMTQCQYKISSEISLYIISLIHYITLFRVYVRICACVCVRACACVCVRACVRACVRVNEFQQV